MWSLIVKTGLVAFMVAIVRKVVKIIKWIFGRKS